MGLDEIKNLLHNKRNGRQIEDATHRKVENFLPGILLLNRLNRIEHWYTITIKSKRWTLNISSGIM
jgi:hypothetical protein